MFQNCFFSSNDTCSCTYDLWLLCWSKVASELWGQVTLQEGNQYSNNT